MSQADVLFQIITMVIGASAGAVVSLYFFRAQQKTDFNKIIDRLSDIRTQLSGDGASHHHRFESVARSLTSLSANLQAAIRDLASIKGDGASHQQRFDSVAHSLTSLDMNVQAATRDLACIKVATDTASVIDMQSSLNGLRSAYDKLNAEVSELAGKIVREFRDQQGDFMRTVQTEFAKSVDSSKGALEQALVNELAPLIPSVNEQKAVVEKLIDLTGYAMLTMGKYQLKIVESQSTNALEQTGQRVTESISELRTDVKEMKSLLDTLPRLTMQT